MSSTTAIRNPAVAGSFYPRDPVELRQTVERHLRDASSDSVQLRPKALIVPHAGYQYSGPVAASGYARLRAAGGSIRRVVLLGPAHRVPVQGLAAPRADTFATPLGPITIDHESIRAVQHLPQVLLDDTAHRMEHSLEVQLPFLQVVLPSFSLVPFAVGDVSAECVAEVLTELWDGPETLIVVSSDLSHFHDYETARRLDEQTSQAIERLQWRDLQGDRACGYVALRGLLRRAAELGLSVRRVDLRNSGDTAGPRDRVVGYGAYVAC